MANMIGRKKPGVKPGEKGSYAWDDPEICHSGGGWTYDMWSGRSSRYVSYTKKDRRGVRRNPGQAGDTAIALIETRVLRRVLS
jgi:hypothetical protein